MKPTHHGCQRWQQLRGPEGHEQGHISRSTPMTGPHKHECTTWGTQVPGGPGAGHISRSTSMTGPHKHECPACGIHQGPGEPGAKSHIKSYVDDRPNRHQHTTWALRARRARCQATPDRAGMSVSRDALRPRRARSQVAYQRAAPMTGSHKHGCTMSGPGGPGAKSYTKSDVDERTAHA